MSKLEELIKKLCPNGVECKKIDDYIDYIQPSKYLVESIKYDDSFDTPVLTAGQSFILGYTNETNGIYEASKENPVIIFDDFTAGFHWVDFKFKVKSSAMKILVSKGNINFRYFYHIMGKLNISSSEHTRLWIGTYSQFEIPIPPMEVQCEIVRILDNFTELTGELTAELAAELTARLKQYEFYKNQLLEFNKNQGIPFIKINELASYRRGSFPQPYGRSEWYDGEGAMAFVQVADIGDDMRLVTNTKRKISIIAQSKSVFAPKGSIIISLQGSIGRIAITQYDAFIDRTVAIFNKLSDKLVPKYFVYQLQRIFAIKEKTARGSTIKTITKEEFTDFLIPVPPIDKQEYIVSILDRFDQVCNDITSGLPAEIVARQKQYEYYRDKLLTFKELQG